MGQYFQPLSGSSAGDTASGTSASLSAGSSMVRKAGCGCGGHGGSSTGDAGMDMLLNSWQRRQTTYCRRQEMLQHLQLILVVAMLLYVFILLIRVMRGTAA